MVNSIDLSEVRGRTPGPSSPSMGSGGGGTQDSGDEGSWSNMLVLRNQGIRIEREKEEEKSVTHPLSVSVNHRPFKKAYG